MGLTYLNSGWFLLLQLAFGLDYIYIYIVLKSSFNDFSMEKESKYLDGLSNYFLNGFSSYLL